MELMKKHLKVKLMKMENLFFHLTIDNNISLGELKTQIKVTMPGLQTSVFKRCF